MTNRSVGRTFLSTGHPPDRSWMESGQTRPSWREKGPRSTRDSGMGSMENWYGLVPPQPGRHKRHACCVRYDIMTIHITCMHIPL